MCLVIYSNTSKALLYTIMVCNLKQYYLMAVVWLLTFWLTPAKVRWSLHQENTSLTSLSSSIDFGYILLPLSGHQSFTEKLVATNLISNFKIPGIWSVQEYEVSYLIHNVLFIRGCAAALSDWQGWQGSESLLLQCIWHTRIHNVISIMNSYLIRIRRLAYLCACVEHKVYHLPRCHACIDLY